MSDDDGNGTHSPAPAVSRAVRLLDVLAHARAPMTLTELSSRLGAAKSSTMNVCLALEAGEMVERGPLGYRLGRRVAELGGAFAAQFNQVREFYAVCEASPVLRDELVQVAVLDGTDALYLARHEGTRNTRIGTPLGSRLPAALSATGRALLMRLPDDAVTALYDGVGALPDLTGHGIRDVPALLDRLRQSRSRGWTLDEGESFAGVCGVGVAVQGWAPGDPDLALGAAIPIREADDARVARVGEALGEAARALTNPFSAEAGMH